METLFFEKPARLKKEIKSLEETLKVKLTLKGTKLEIE